jgi:hypothetical protein
MGKKTARYRRQRDDRYGHPKTGGMKLQAYGLSDYAVAQNLLGVLRQSPQSIAAQFGNTLREVKDAIEILTTARNGREPNARWWPELETLWIVEAFDEQSDPGKADVAARKQLASLPSVVQAALVERYGARLGGHGPSDGGCDGPSDGVSTSPFLPGIREQVTGNREQESGEPPTPAGGGGSKRKASRASNESRIGEILDAIDRERARCTPPLPPLTETQRSATTIAAAFGRGATVERLLECVGAWGRYVERDPSKASRLTPSKLFSGPNAQRGYAGGLAWCEELIDEERVLEVRAKRVTRQRGPAEPSPRPESSGEVDLGEIGGAT